MLTFEELKSLEKFNVQPDSVKFLFGGPEGDDFQRLECGFEIEQEDHWERFMRFMHRYAEANDLVYSLNQ